MKEYLKMADVFDCELLIDCDCDDAIVDEQSFVVLESFDGSDVAKYAAHAINSHDELVAEVERLRRQLACAFMAGWEEGVNGMECDEAEVASVELAEQFARN